MSDHQVAAARDAFPAEIMEQMQRGLHQARGTMAPETERAMRRAFAAFRQWSAGRGMSDLPATSESVAGYVDELATSRCDIQWRSAFACYTSEYPLR